MANPQMPKGMQPIVAGYSFGGPGGAMSAQVSGGMARYGLDYDRGVQRFTVALMLTTKTQLFIWSLFYHQVIKQGTITFDMPLDSGFGLSLHACNIVPQSYSMASLDAFSASVGFTVEAESQAYTYDDATAGSLVDLFSLYGEDVNPLFARLALFVNSDVLALNQV